MKKILKKRFIIPILFILICVIGWTAYVNDYYNADSSVDAYMPGVDSDSTELEAVSDRDVTVTQIEDGLLLDGQGSDKAVIFYPGAKVEYTAYLPMLYQLAQQGTDVFLIKMPANLAFFGINKADTIMEQYQYDQWYMAGHSLGGAMAASYAAKHLDELDGLILFAAYPTKALKSDDFSVLTLYGSEDHVVNMDKIISGRAYMPAQYAEVCIEDGNHAQFGNYGEQEGDGIALISADEQQAQAVEAISEMMQPGAE